MLAWSIVLATKGVEGLVDALTTLESLGYDFSPDRRLVEGDWMEIPDGVRKAAGAVTAGLAIFLSLVAIATVLSWFGWISL